MALMIPLTEGVQKALLLDGRSITIYANPNDNMDYVIYENNSEHFVVADEMDPGNYEGNRTVIHTPPVNSPLTRKRKHGSSVNEGAKTLFKPVKSNEEKMCVIQFVDYFMKEDWEQNPSIEDLITIYDVLNSFSIDRKVLDVVSAALHFMCTKTLVNTMRRNCDRRNKKFKKQLQYVLSAVCKRLPE